MLFHSGRRDRSGRYQGVSYTVGELFVGVAMGLAVIVWFLSQAWAGFVIATLVGLVVLPPLVRAYLREQRKVTPPPARPDARAAAVPSADGRRSERPRRSSRR